MMRLELLVWNRYDSPGMAENKDKTGENVGSIRSSPSLLKVLLF